MYQEVLMLKVDVVRAWKDEEYRLGLSAEQQTGLPENPAGLIQLSDEGMSAAQGGWGVFTNKCTNYTTRCESICMTFSC